MWYFNSPTITLDNQHGFGIIFVNNAAGGAKSVFYEDETILPLAEDVSDTRAITYLKDFKDTRWHRFTQKENREMELLVSEGICRFRKGKNQTVQAVIGPDKKSFTIRIEKDRFSYEGKCSCGKIDCIHAKAASVIASQRIDKLKHAYVVTDQPVDKSLFLDPALTNAVAELREREIDTNLIREERAIIGLLNAAKSSDYTWTFHNYMLSLDPKYNEYDSHFLESSYGYLLLALFENSGYQKSVIAEGSYADPEDYETRQHRSNRACLKRTLKEYNRIIKDIDVRGDYSPSSYKEFILKYRGDLPALLCYYAFGKELLDDFDLPFLEQIAESPDIDLKVVPEAAVKLDDLSMNDQAVQVFHRLADRLSPDQRIGLYSNLRNITMTLEEIQRLAPEDQQKLINSMPLSVDSIHYTFDRLLADRTAAEKGRYLLGTLNRPGAANDRRLKRCLIEKAAELPDNRLLLTYVRSKVRTTETVSPNQGDSEKELSTYFDCRYELINNGDSFHSVFTVEDPESDAILLMVKEINGKVVPETDTYLNLRYSGGLIRKVCLAGKEEQYRREAEACREAVEAFLFEKEHRKFVHDYRKFCTSLTEEKLLFTPEAKAGIEWQVYTDGSSYALSFRVGHRKKYVVKDASEFLKAFKTGQTSEYGKDLILTHDPDNLDESDAAAVQILMSAKYTKGRKSDRNNKRYISVGDSLLGNLFEHLSGRTILLNEMPVLLRMDPVKVRLKIDKNYTLSSDLNPDTQTFLNLGGKGYIVTHPKNRPADTIDRMDAVVEEVNLVDLVEKNPSTRIKPILPDFKKNIYLHYFEMIDVDPSIRKDFELSSLRFHTYFDFEKSQVTARTVILRDDVEIPEAALTARIDRMKYDVLDHYLTGMGFSEGVMTDESRILSFFKMDFTQLKKLTNVYLSESLKNKELRSVGKPVIRVTYKNNLVHVFMEKGEYDESEMEKIIAGLRKKKKYILLDGDRIVDLDSEAARDLGDAVKDFGMNPKDLYRRKTVSMVTAIKAFSHERCCSIDKYLRSMIGEIRSFKEADISAPNLQGELRDYQAEGFRWLSVLSRYNMGGVLADDMGLGKTIQIIALIKSDRSRKPSLVVCPKSLVFNWISEFARFDGATEVTAIYGTEAQRSERIASIDYKGKAVYVTSYDSLRNDIEKYTGEFNYAILDEAQYIKNIHAQKTKSVKEIRALHRFALTGTPIENSVVDLWSIFDFIMPGYFEELSQFKDSDTEVIARKAAPFILRRVKGDVLEDLPSKYERILSADMSEGQRKVYEAMRMDARKQLEKGGRAFDILPYLTRLRQVCVDPALFVEGYTEGSGKLDLLSSLIPEYLQNGHRILIFSQFVKALEEVALLLTEQGIPSYFLSGATPARERMQMMDSFNNGSGTDVFLISLKAGGTGLNLTGADTVIHLDPWWNVAAENQASDRTHRIGQTRNVEVIKLIAADSIEQRVLELQNIKKEVIRQVISDNDGSVTSASLEDIAFVLE